MNKSILTFLIIAVSVLILGGVGYYLFVGQQVYTPPTSTAVTARPINGNQTPANNSQCATSSDCQNGATCMVVGPLIANQPVRRVCVPQGQAVPL